MRSGDESPEATHTGTLTNVTRNGYFTSAKPQIKFVSSSKYIHLCAGNVKCGTHVLVEDVLSYGEEKIPVVAPASEKYSAI